MSQTKGGRMASQKNSRKKSSKRTKAVHDADVTREKKGPRVWTSKTVSRRPSIIISNRQLPDVSVDAVKALVASNSPHVIFQREGVLVRLKHDRGGPAIQVISDAALRGLLARAADWHKIPLAGRVAAHPPIAVVRDIMALLEIPGIPSLKGIVEAPSFGPDKTLLVTPGYHPAAQLWFHNARGFLIPSVNPNPSPARVKQAVDTLIEELLGDFPFDGDASRAHPLPAILLPFARELIAGP